MEYFSTSSYTGVTNFQQVKVFSAHPVHRSFYDIIQKEKWSKIHSWQEKNRLNRWCDENRTYV